MPVLTLPLGLFLSQLLVPFLGVSSDWTQQYGNPSSTSYTDYTGPVFTLSDWNFTTDPFVSETSPSVNEDGVIFYPLRAYVVAIAPNGSTLWKTGVAPNGEAYLTNTLYSRRHNFVIVGGSWVDQKTFFQVVALNASSGKMVWTSPQNHLYHATTLSISNQADVVFCGGYDESTFAAMRLIDGKSVWSLSHIYQVGIFMQTKVGPFTHTGQTSLTGDRTGLTSSTGEIAILPTDPYNGINGRGRLFAYDVAKLKRWPFGREAILWHVDLGFTAGGLFAFTPFHGGLIYGSNAGSEGGQGDIFIVNASSGGVLTNEWGLCDRGADGMSGPVVDDEGNCYLSCGNQLFSIYPNGSLRWVSKKFGNATLNTVVSPSIHPKGKVFFIHNNHTHVYQMNTLNAGDVVVYDVPDLGYLEPPILLGDKMMYLMGFEGNSITMFPLKLLL